ncbi:TOPRIM nucleotidyl transferase/hydrolase domain-containing protein [Micromonospora sp. DT46]|uniref:TOPRIM nucleotidyl transferase/hydrolase domain-containing protein n=1 Tax=unclassified Micromonospora TaxID=2617518 RepID=UPI00124BAB59|nr:MULTISPECIES: TOPRIM nucleotidyl transferase/hydrolase domain-containing protein [unclassified Micromonospora]KAB1161387.1 ATP-dependent endonuclease [Micromonospora sp. AMSO12t]WSG00989.1 ATP-dependent endonuclease [Micromonospora sp. NBC_01740]
MRSIGDLAPGTDARTVVLVEGPSDRVALETLAARRGRDLGAEGVRVVAMGGATNVGHFLDQLGPAGRGLRLAGLYDEAEEGYFRRGLERCGFGVDLSRADLTALGFHVCVADLEDELIRAVGVAGVRAVLAAEGELRSFDLFQRQPAQRGRAVEAQLRRFLGTRSGRKSAYARLLVQALEPDRVPRSLDAVLAGV